MKTLPASRYTTESDPDLPLLGIDLGYSAANKSCGLATSFDRKTFTLTFGDCIEFTLQTIGERGPCVLIIEAVLSTYHRPDGNPDIRGDFEKGRGWYYGPGVTTYAAAVRLLGQLDLRLPEGIRLPLVEGFLSYKKARTRHVEDARRLVDEFARAEVFHPRTGTHPISTRIEGVPPILRYNAP